MALIVLGGLAIYGGTFGQQNVRDRLEPQNITFPPFEAMTPEEQEEIGDFAGRQVVDGQQAQAFSRYIGGHLSEVNEGATYSETSSAAREEGLDPDVAAELQGKADTLFKGRDAALNPVERLRLVDRCELFGALARHAQELSDVGDPHEVGRERFGSHSRHASYAGAWDPSSDSVPVLDRVREDRSAAFLGQDPNTVPTSRSPRSLP